MFIHFEFHLSFYYLVAQSHKILLQGFTATAHLYYVINLTTFANFLTLLITPCFRSVICKINIAGFSTAPCRTALMSLCCKGWPNISALCFLSFQQMIYLCKDILSYVLLLVSLDANPESMPKAFGNPSRTVSSTHLCSHAFVDCFKVFY